MKSKFYSANLERHLKQAWPIVFKVLTLSKHLLVHSFYLSQIFYISQFCSDTQKKWFLLTVQRHGHIVKDSTKRQLSHVSLHVAVKGSGNLSYFQPQWSQWMASNLCTLRFITCYATPTKYVSVYVAITSIMFIHDIRVHKSQSFMNWWWVGSALICSSLPMFVFKSFKVHVLTADFIYICVWLFGNLWIWATHGAGRQLWAGRAGRASWPLEAEQQSAASQHL